MLQKCESSHKQNVRNNQFPVSLEAARSPDGKGRRGVWCPGRRECRDPRLPGLFLRSLQLMVTNADRSLLLSLLISASKCGEKGQ